MKESHEETRPVLGIEELLNSYIPIKNLNLHEEILKISKMWGLNRRKYGHIECKNR